MAINSPGLSDGEDVVEYPIRRVRRCVTATIALVAAVLVSACSTTGKPPATPGSPGSAHAGHGWSAPPAEPLRAGERFVTVTMPQPYTPAAPNGGTDEYRCFLV